MRSRFDQLVLLWVLSWFLGAVAVSKRFPQTPDAILQVMVFVASLGIYFKGCLVIRNMVSMFRAKQ